mgnify:CR=1 FL=1|tara:strand:- start:29947 stop:32304 length:2358 start_codon:yes stop_codon:yes gene_type:complete
MINPAKFQSVLGQVQDAQLMEMLKRPDKIPTNFVVAEINRRQAMRTQGKAQQAAQAQNMSVMPHPQMKPQAAQRQPAQQPQGMYDGGVPMRRPSLGERNRNPLNLRPLTGEQFFGTTGVNKGYSTFDSDIAGLRAGFINMDASANRGIDNINDYINRFAPASDQPNAASTENYKKFVADAVGVGVDDKVDFRNPDFKKRLLKAQIVFENGQNRYSDETIDRAFELSGDLNTNPFGVSKRQVSTVNQPPSTANMSNQQLVNKAKAQIAKFGSGNTGSGRPQILDTIDELVAAKDVRSLNALATDPSVVDTYGQQVQTYAKNALGKMTANRQPLVPSQENAQTDRAGIGSISGRGFSTANPLPKRIDDAKAAQEAEAAKFPFGSQRDMAAAYSRLQNPEGRNMEDDMSSAAGIKSAYLKKFGNKMNTNMVPLPKPKPKAGGSGAIQSFFNRLTTQRDDDATDGSLLGDDDGQGRSSGIYGGPPISPGDRKPGEAFGKRLENQITSRGGSSSTAKAVVDAVKDSTKSSLGKTNLSQIGELGFFDTKIKEISEQNKALLDTYNEGTTELIKARKELMAQFDAQKRTPQSMFFDALIQVGLDLAASPEANFGRALAGAAKQGIASYENMTKQQQENMFKKYKMAYDIANDEFQHKLKGQKLAMDLNVSLVGIADTLSQISYRQKMGDAAGINAEARLAKANQPPKPNASVYNSVMGQFYKLQEDPLAALSEAQRLGLAPPDATEVTPATMNMMEQYYDKMARSRASDFSSSASNDSDDGAIPLSTLLPKI